MTSGNELKSPNIGRKKDDPPNTTQQSQQLQLQQQSLEYERARLDEEKASFEKIKKDLKELLDGIKVHEKSYEKVGSWSRKHRGSLSNLYKVDSKDNIPKHLIPEKKQDKQEKDAKKKKEKESKKKAVGKGEEIAIIGKDISAPFNVQHRVHVDFDYKWTGQDPEDVFELTVKLGEGYIPPSLILSLLYTTPLLYCICPICIANNSFHQSIR